MSTTWWSASKAWIKAHWPLIKKVITFAFIALVLTLIATAATRVDWPEVLEAIRALSTRTLLTAGLIALASYVVYSSYDVIGKWYTGHALPWWRAMMVGFISYAFTMNMGAPVGGIGLRIRLYSKQGLKQGVVMRVMALSITTNWIGYAILAGAIFALGGVRLPPEWEVGSGAFRVIGVIMVVFGLAYLLLCAFSRTRSWTIRGHQIELPSIGIALLQVCVAMLNWTLMGLVIYTLMPEKAEFLLVLGALLVSAVAGAITHVPGGIGVIESVFMALLASEHLPRSQILGTILVYRAVYYIVPLLIAAVLYLGAEAKIKAPAEDAEATPETGTPSH